MLKVVFVLVGLVAVTASGETVEKWTPESKFVIPRSLMVRMHDAEDRAANLSLNPTNHLDVPELWSLAVVLQMTNAQEIASRPRGHMEFCDDLLSDEDRERQWPFEIEALEVQLEAKMEVSEEHGYRVKPQFAHLAGGGGDDGYVPGSPTIRWVNSEIERWAVKEMDAKRKRLDEATLRKIFCVEKVPEGVLAWRWNEDWLLLIDHGSGSWNPRDYSFVFCREGSKPGLIIAFDSFPNRREAAAVFQLRSSVAGFNNVAVMMWEHQCDRLRMNPEAILVFLEKAIRGGVPHSAENLEVLRSHIPELF